MANTNSLPIPEFNGEDYEYWSLKMKTLLIGKGFWDIVEDGHIEDYEELRWSSLEGEEKRERNEKQYQNCCALMEIRKAMKENTFPLIASCKSAKQAWKRLQEVYGNSYELDCKSKGEPCFLEKLFFLEEIFDDPFDGCFEESCEDPNEEHCKIVFVGDMSYEGIYNENDDGEFLKEEYEDWPCEELFLVEKREEVEECLMEETYEVCPLKTPSQPFDEECSMEEAQTNEAILMEENEEEPTTHCWQECFFNKAQDEDTLNEECCMAKYYSHGVDESHSYGVNETKAQIIWDDDPHEQVNGEEMEFISSMLMQDHSSQVKKVYLKEERVNSEIVLCKESLCEEEKSTPKEITFKGDTYLYANDLFECFENRFEIPQIVTILEASSLDWHENHPHGMIKIFKESLPLEKTMMDHLFHKSYLFHFCNILIPWKESCEVSIRSNEIYEEQHMVAYVISQCVAIYCLKVCVQVCEIINMYSCRAWNCNDIKDDDTQTWFKHHVINEGEMNTKDENFFVGGGANFQEVLNDGVTSTTKKILDNERKEWHHIFLQISYFLLYDWRSRKKIDYSVCDVDELLKEVLSTSRGRMLESVNHDCSSSCISCC